MQELDAFEDAANAGGSRAASRQGGPPRKNAKEIAELEQEMKLLHWHKLANEAALKAALIRTKKLKEQDSGRAVVETRKERAQWMQQIIEEEQAKPLEVSEDFILKYEEAERVEEERLEAEVQRHIQSLQKIKKNLREKEQVRQRTMVYRAKQKALLAPLGLGPGSGGDSQVSSLPAMPSVSEGGSMSGTLSKVINSLDKLVDLEKRIARLETDVGPESSVGSATGVPAQRTRIKFKKRRKESTATRPSMNVFSVTHVPVQRKKQGRGRRRRPRHDDDSRRRRDNDGTFLTSLPDPGAAAVVAGEGAEMKIRIL